MIIKAADVFEQVVRLGDELHVAILDAVVDHLDEVTRAFGADVGDARAVVVGFGGNGFEDWFEMSIGVLIPARHEAGSPERAFLAAAHAHAEEFDPCSRKLIDPPFRVGE